LLLSYALFYQKDSVFIFAHAFTWIPYIRNLIIHRRHASAHLAPKQANYSSKMRKGFLLQGASSNNGSSADLFCPAAAPISTP